MCGAGIAVEVACLTDDNTRASTPSWISASDGCPAACTAAWDALIAECPGHTKSWTLGGACADGSGMTEDDCESEQWSDTATDWVPMYVAGDGTGDAYSVAARVMLKWLELGLEMDVCPLSSPVCDVSGCHSTQEATAVEMCSVMQRLAQYSALSSPAAQTSPTTGLGCDSECSTACRAIEEATWAVGTGACCADGTQADRSDCMGVSPDLGAQEILLLDYVAMRTVYSASSACETFTCSTENLANAFCSQTAGTYGPFMCNPAIGKMSLISTLLPDDYDVPAEIRSCIDELANNGRCSDTSHKTETSCDAATGTTWTPTATATSEMTVYGICATTSSPCPGSVDEDDDDDDDDDVDMTKTTSAAPSASGWSAFLIAATSYSVWGSL